jgi:hypothetical protein
VYVQQSIIYIYKSTYVHVPTLEATAPFPLCLWSSYGHAWNLRDISIFFYGWGGKGEILCRGTIMWQVATDKHWHLPNSLANEICISCDSGCTLTSIEQSSKRILHFLWQRIYTDIYPTFRQTKQAFRVTNDTSWHLSIGLANKTNISFASGNVAHLDASPRNRKSISSETVTIYFVYNSCHPHSHYNDQSANNV